MKKAMIYAKAPDCYLLRLLQRVERERFVSLGAYTSRQQKYGNDAEFWVAEGWRFVVLPPAMDSDDILVPSSALPEFEVWFDGKFSLVSRELFIEMRKDRRYMLTIERRNRSQNKV